MRTRVTQTSASARACAPRLADSSALQRGERYLWLTIAPERVAIAKAISEGETRLSMPSRCGGYGCTDRALRACRQLIWEFCGDVPVILANLKGKIEIVSDERAFPKPFDAPFYRQLVTWAPRKECARSAEQAGRTEDSFSQLRSEQRNSAN